MIKLLVLAAALFLSGPQRQSLLQEAEGITNYDVHYIRGAIRAKMATAALTLEKTTWEGEPVLYAGFSIRAVNLFRLFMKDTYQVNDYLNLEDLHPVFYSYPFTKNGKQVVQEILYDKSSGIIEVVYKTEGVQSEAVRTIPLDGVTMEPPSLLFLLRTLDPSSLEKTLKAGAILDGFRVAAEISFQGEDNDYWPGETAFHYQISLLERGLLENGSGNEIHVWISAAPTREMLGLEVPLGKGAITVRMRNNSKNL